MFLLPILYVSGSNKRTDPGLTFFRQGPDIYYRRRTHQIFEGYFVPCLIPKGSCEIAGPSRGAGRNGRGVEVGTAVLVHYDEVGLVWVSAPGLAGRPFYLGEPIPVVVGVGHVPWPRTGQPLRYGQ